ncbi:MAG: ubiquinone/menaquinone biosynthesis methyltransferase [Actinobacteria bacterium]|nr:ubiquinone/menaquinone biosynthesis methyltransferase [Actinomycetota bacterium]
MFDRIAPRYERLNQVLTFGLDGSWRRRAVRALALPARSRVLDLACGTGDLCRELSAHGVAPVGVDRSAGMLTAARAEAPLVRGDVLALPMPPASVDGIVCGFALRNFVALEPFLAECARVIRPGGRLALLEVSTPRHPLARAAHRLYFERAVPWIGGLLSDRAAYRYLPRSVAYLPPDPELLRMIGDAGFPDARRRALTLGAAQILMGTRG